MMNEPNTIASDTTSNLEAIEDTKKKTVVPSTKESFSDRLLLTPVMTTANPKVAPVDDSSPTGNDSGIKYIFDDFLGLPPMTGFWRVISDQFVREQIHDSNRNTKEAQALDDVSQHAPGLERTFDSDDRSTHALPDVNPSDDALCPDNHLGCDGYAKSSSTSFIDDGDDDDDEPYLDPVLVHHAHSFHGIPSDIPKFVTFSSGDSVRDSPEQVVFGGSPKKVQNGLLELNPGEFVRVHGIKHAQDAIRRGKSAVAECSVCSRRYAVDESARALYCTACDSVTDIRNDFKKGKESALWH